MCGVHTVLLRQTEDPLMDGSVKQLTVPLLEVGPSTGPDHEGVPGEAEGVGGQDVGHAAGGVAWRGAGFYLQVTWGGAVRLSEPKIEIMS